MKWTYVIALLIILIVVANIIALNALPDSIVGLSMVGMVVILGLLLFFFLRRRQR